MKSFTILLVDDEPSILRALRSALHPEGYDIYTAENGETALHALKEYPIDLIISDQRMPGMTGIELFGKVKAENPDILCILLTGFPEIDVVVKAINLGGIYKFITKPWDDAQLILTVRRALEYLAEVRERRRNLETIEIQNRELFTLNHKLEQLVEERTADLQAALDKNMALNRQLELKIKELEIRDQLLTHMLEIHTRDESLLKIVVSISNLVEAEQVMIFLGTSEAEMLVPCFGWDRQRELLWSGSPDRGKSTDFYIPPEHLLLKIISDQREVLQLAPSPENGETPYACLPVIKGETTLGVLLLSNPIQKNAISPEYIQSLRSLLHYVVMVIEDIGMLDQLADISRFTDTLEE